MHSTSFSRFPSRFPWLAGLLCLFCLTACARAPAPRVVIEIVTVVHIMEVTRLVPIPVTVTSSPTPARSHPPSLSPTITRTPSIANTPEAPIITILIHAACNYGPGSAYLYKYGLLETSHMEVIGRNLEGTWLFVQGIHGWNPCWVRADQVHFDTGGLDAVPVASSILPYSTLYFPPQNLSSTRVGNKVTLFWSPVWMTEDDYRGYLIEAWVCQGRQMVFLPIIYFNMADQSRDLLAIEVIDEPGCLVSSSARIHTAEKHGYSGSKLFLWPVNEASPTPSTTRTP